MQTTASGSATRKGSAVAAPRFQRYNLISLSLTRMPNGAFEISNACPNGKAFSCLPVRGGGLHQYRNSHSCDQ